MDLIVNDLSIGGQFGDATEARAALERLMRIRQVALRFGRDLYCSRTMAVARVTHSQTLLQILSTFDRDAQQALMVWLTRGGPFWIDEREHSPNDYYEARDEVVTDTGLGEAAHCRRLGIIPERRVVSATPSDWELDPIRVDLVTDDGRDPVDVPNYWTEAAVEAELQAVPLPLQSWGELSGMFIGPTSRCPHLTFATDAFAPLIGRPFVLGAAERIVVLLDTLEALRRCAGGNGGWTTEGYRILAEHFSGSKAWFSRSSQTEENDFEKELTFPDPSDPEKFLFCTWHGKVKIDQIRIHISDPTPPPIPLRVVYVGAKLTKR